MDGLSIIVPTKNHGDTLFQFVQQVSDVLTKQHIEYEIIFVDDNSTDLTQHIIQNLAQVYPIRFYVKNGATGKVQSILEGATYANFQTLVTIDTKEYHPKAIISMLQKVDEGYDIVVAKREWKKGEKIHALGENGFAALGAKIFHNMDLDVTSRLKVFRKEILEKLTFSPTSFPQFNLEFLVRAQAAGYRITQVSIPFEKYFAEKSQKSTLSSAIGITKEAIDLRFQNPDVIPFHKDVAQKKGKGFHFKGKEFIHYSAIGTSDSAFFRLTANQKKVLVFSLLLIIVSLFFNWHTTLVAIIGTLTFLYFSDLLFHFYLIVQSFLKPQEIHIAEVDLHQERTWPTYTIFCPLYKESSVLPQFIQAIECLSYPKEKLQVLLLLEEDDRDTQAKVKTLPLPPYFDIRITPHSFPKTKPKALNFGLQFAVGEFCVVYDAEDIPDPLQLKKIVLAFERAAKDVKCIQAKLNFYNPFQNILTRVFTAEYSLWFDLVLTGLQSTHAVIPLGGTSNHFKTNELKAMHGWDSFNVTEDCDLGLRIAKQGFATAMVNSTTLEEANSDPFNWFQQRGRWIKGYMQTYLVHVRNPRQFIKQATLKQFIIFQLVIGGKIMSLFVNPLMWIITISYFTLRPLLGPFIESFFPTPIMYMGVLCLVFGNFLYLYYYMIGCAKREQYSLIKYAFLVPLYWLGMSLSGWHALYKIITQPYYWAKTRHGLHLQTQKKNETTAVQRANLIPRISF